MLVMASYAPLLSGFYRPDYCIGIAVPLTALADTRSVPDGKNITSLTPMEMQ